MLVNQTNKAGKVIVAMLLAFIGLILFYNVDTVMARMGFETKASVKSDLAQAKERLDTVISSNEQLTKQLESQALAKQEVDRQLKELRQTNEEIKTQVEFHKSQRAQKAKPSFDKVKSTAVKTDKTYTFELEASQEVARVNIESLHHAFASLSNPA